MAIAIAMAMAMATATAMAMTTATAMAVAVIRPRHAIGADLPENRLFIKHMFLSLFWSFLDLLDRKNECGSKFYAGKWYREVWKLKINLFRAKTMNS